jgi:hypothetical protein
VTNGNLELLQVLVSWAVTLPSVYAILVLDERRLPGRMLARAWPKVSRDAAIFAIWNIPFLLLVVPLVHFIRTRRSVRGLLLGVAWVSAVLVANFAAELATVAAVDWLGL